MDVKEIFESVKPILINILYGVIIILIFILFDFIIVLLKRWYRQAKIRGAKEDFGKATEYIRNTSKKLTLFERVSLAQTGEVISLKFFFFCIILVFIFNLLVFFGYYLYKSNNSFKVFFDNFTFLRIIFSGIKIISFLSVFCFWIYAWRSLVKFARFSPLIYWTIILTIYVWMSYDNICYLIQMVFFKSI